jgi:hypothetical protein
VKLKVYWADIRGDYTSSIRIRTKVVDEDTGKEVGFVEATRSPVGGASLSLVESTNAILQPSANVKHSPRASKQC